jgi:hypothetical protein
MNAFVIRRMAVILWIGAAAMAQPYDQYVWRTHQATNIPADAQSLVVRLREEIDKITGAGHLAPMRQYYADLDNTAYYLYHEPGRIILTLGAAYPYLSAEQKTAVRSYVADELSNPDYTPWSSNNTLPEGEGSHREFFNVTQEWGWGHWYGMDGQNRPRLFTLYGLWLYAYNSGDHAVVSDNWNAVKSYYSSNSSRGNIYGAVSGHLAMARMALLVDDASMMSTASANAEAALSAGASFAAVQSSTESYYAYKYDSRNDNLIYHGWMFLNMPPEIGLYLRDTVYTDVAANHQWVLDNYPFWWVAKFQYWTRWTGDEGIGLPSEVVGMVFPVERWVLERDAATLAGYRMDAACHMRGIGDCYAIEALINTINAYGDQSWVDIRTAGPVTDPFAFTVSTTNRVLSARTLTMRPIVRGGAISMIVELSHPSPVTVRIMTLSGRTVSSLSQQLRAGTAALPMTPDRLTPGVYVLRSTIGGESIKSTIAVR